MRTSREAQASSALYRDVAVVAAALVAVTLHVLGDSWFLVAVAAVAAAAWITAARRPLPFPGWITQVAFVVLGALLVWRFAERLLWLSVAGMWLLVAAADLTRLCVRFPQDASPLDQRLLVNRRIQLLALLGLAAAALVWVSLALTLELRLMAVSLLALFTVMVVIRVVRSLAGAEFPRDDDQVRR